MNINEEMSIMSVYRERRLPGLLLVLAMTLQVPLVLAHGDEPHGDHDAQHGGFVMMYEDIHFELALVTEGGVQVYYTDAARNELPAATVSDVVVEIERPGASTEYVTMAISAAGDAWEGASTPVSEPEAVVRVGFLYEGAPLMLDVPASALIAVPATDAALTEAGEHAGH